MSIRTTKNQGFSLVELLVVVAVIGVIAAIAIPNIGNINSSATTATSQRNAQSIVSLYAYGNAAGIAWAGSDRNAKIRSVVAGATPTDGAFAGRTFKLPNVDALDQKSAYPYIGFDSAGDLFYDKNGHQSSS